MNKSNIPACPVAPGLPACPALPGDPALPNKGIN